MTPISLLDILFEKHWELKVKNHALINPDGNSHGNENWYTSKKKKKKNGKLRFIVKSVTVFLA